MTGPTIHHGVIRRRRRRRRDVKLEPSDENISEPTTQRKKLKQEKICNFFVKPEEIPIEEYQMSTSESSEKEFAGLGLIFNFRIFDDKPQQERKGTEKDVTNLQNLFFKMKLSTLTHNNLTKKEVLQAIEDFSKDNRHNDLHMAFIAILTHGNEKGLLTKDYKILDLYTEVFPKLNEQNCPGLAGKPKLFLIQACRGHMLSKVSRDADDTDQKVDPSLAPSIEDCIAMFSSVPLYSSLRCDKFGSLFVQSIVQVFGQYGAKEAFGDLWLRVCSHMNSRRVNLAQKDQFVTLKLTPELRQLGVTKRLFFKMDPNPPYELRSRIMPMKSSIRVRQDE